MDVTRLNSAEAEAEAAAGVRAAADFGIVNEIQNHHATTNLWHAIGDVLALFYAARRAKLDAC
jgi:hypothetical protein